MRLVNRVVAAVVAILIAAAGILVAVEVFVAQVLKRGPWIIPYDRWLHSARTESWASSDAVLQLGVGLVVAGVVLLSLELWPRRPTQLQVVAGPDLDVKVQRRSLERSLTRAAERVDAVRSADVKVRPDSVHVEVTTDRREVPTLKADVTTAVIGALNRVHPTPEPSVRVDVAGRHSS